MTELFLKLLNMSITASWLVLAVAVLRPVLRKAPKWLRVVMWSFVGVRLVFPFSVESILSLIPTAEPIPDEVITPTVSTPAVSVPVTDAPVLDPTPAVSAPVGGQQISGIIPEALPVTDTPPAPSLAEMAVNVAAVIWVIGVLAMAVYAIVSYVRIWRKVREASPLEGRVWQCDSIDSPFILGFIRPRIYLPTDIVGDDVKYVIAHERAHLRRGDHLWKPIGFALLSVYWFNPVIWVAYILLCRDIEFACDEKVIREMGREIKKPYSSALINCSAPKKLISACPLAFGETGVVARIKGVLHYKKPAVWVMAVSMVTCIALVLCFLTDPMSPKAQDNGGAGEPHTEQGGELTEPERDEAPTEGVSESAEESEPTEGAGESAEESEPTEGASESAEESEPAEGTSAPAAPYYEAENEPIAGVADPAEEAGSVAQMPVPDDSAGSPLYGVSEPAVSYSITVRDGKLTGEQISYTAFTSRDITPKDRHNTSGMSAVMQSVSDLEAYSDASSVGFISLDGRRYTVKELEDFAKYDEAYFEENVLIALFHTYPSGTLAGAHGIDSVVKDGGELCVNVHKAYESDFPKNMGFTADVAFVTTFVEISKAHLEGVDTFTYFNRREPSKVSSVGVTVTPEPTEPTEPELFTRVSEPDLEGIKTLGKAEYWEGTYSVAEGIADFKEQAVLIRNAAQFDAFAATEQAKMYGMEVGDYGKGFFAKGKVLVFIFKYYESKTYAKYQSVQSITVNGDNSLCVNLRCSADGDIAKIDAKQGYALTTIEMDSCDIIGIDTFNYYIDTYDGRPGGDFPEVVYETWDRTDAPQGQKLTAVDKGSVEAYYRENASLLMRKTNDVLVIHNAAQYSSYMAYLGYSDGAEAPAYDAEFFKENVLILIVKPLRAGSPYEFEGLYRDGRELCVSGRYSPADVPVDYGNTVPPYTVTMVEADREALEGVWYVSDYTDKT